MKRSCLLALVAGAIAIFGNSAAIADDTQPSGVTFSKEVSRIFQKRCEQCHRPGDLAPMSLMTFKDARPWAKSIKKSVAARTMPPWHADAQYGKWTNDISMTDQEMDTVIKWVDAGAPEGDPADLPPALEVKDVEWRAGAPDLKYFPPITYTVPATTEDEYRCMVIPSNFTEDTWVQGFEYKISNRRVVHHIIGFVDSTGNARKKDAETPEPGYICDAGSGVSSNGLDAMIGGWAPGTPPNIYHHGVGKLIPKGADIVLQMHYHNETGKDQIDQSGLGIHLARETIHSRGRIMPVSAWKLNIAPGDPNAEARSQWKVPQDITLGSIMPHMHYLGKDMTVSVAYPDGKNETLISVPRFDFNWQTVYAYVEPKPIPKGSTIFMLAHHDNSAENPRNPSKPPREVHWGEETTNEMAIGWLGYILANEDLNITPKPPEQIIGEINAAKKDKVSANAN